MGNLGFRVIVKQRLKLHRGGFMLNLFKKALHGKVLATIGSLTLLCGVSAPNLGGAKSVLAVQSKEANASKGIGWKKFHSVPGSCSVSLPGSPEHVKQVMPLADSGQDLRYDVYVSAFERKAVYMLLVAQYPSMIDDSYAEMSLETFLNGLITQNPENKLIFADLTEVEGYKALDFFIEARGIYFKGRVVMANNNLYLLAMECETHNYKQEHFDHFIRSFQFNK